MSELSWRAVIIYRAINKHESILTSEKVAEKIANELEKQGYLTSSAATEAEALAIYKDMAQITNRLPVSLRRIAAGQFRGLNPLLDKWINDEFGGDHD